MKEVIICIDCHRETQWSKRTGRRCKECWRKRATLKGREWRERNYEDWRKKATTREYEYRLENREKWLAEHREQTRSRYAILNCPARRKLHTEEVKERRKQDPLWRVKHRLDVANRRNRIMNNGGKTTLDDWRSICDFYGNRCLMCGAPGDFQSLTMDHIVPVAKGGSNNPDNIQPLCHSCNSRKGTRTIDFRPQSLSLQYIEVPNDI